MTRLERSKERRHVEHSTVRRRPIGTNVGIHEFVVSVDKCQQNDGEEPLVVVIQTSRVAGRPYGDMLAVNSATRMREIPSIFKIFSYIQLLFFTCGKIEYFWLHLCYNGFTDFFDEEGNCVVQNSERVGEAVVTVSTCNVPQSDC